MRLVMPEGGIGNAEIEINGAVLMLANAALPDFPSNDTKIHLYVEDVDRAARIANPCGNQWAVASHVDMDEMLRRMPAMGHQ